MSELLLLAAGLLSRTSAGQLPTGNLLPVLPPPADATQMPAVNPAVVPAQPATEQAAQPEFSREANRAATSHSLTADTGGAWTGRRRSLRVARLPRLQRAALAQTAAQNLAFNRLQTAAPQSAAPSTRPPQVVPAQSATRGTTQSATQNATQNATQSATQTGTAGRSPAQLAAASSPAPVLLPATSAPTSRVRPQSGPQQYQQRWAALRQGLTYTRIASDSFAADWLDAAEQPTYEQWVSLLRHEARAMAAGQGSNRLSVLVGDSISQWFPVEQLSRDRFWLNQGISGDTTAGVLRRLSLFQDTRPADIHLMVGINDLRRGATHAEVLNNLSQIMQELRQTHPQSRIWVYSILPTRLPALPPERIFELNQNLEAIARQEKVAYVDLQRFFAEESSGILRRDLTTDGIHLSRTGYALWQWAIGSLI